MYVCGAVGECSLHRLALWFLYGSSLVVDVEGNRLVERSAVALEKERKDKKNEEGKK